ncbi:MAG: porphobilinogen synthase, partial [Dysgonamonadaceae bacterium]|nr:porphobilinogen synthase [Dysgonamonadaceae bacterium]
MKRFRPYRISQEIRDRYADVSLHPSDFIYPYFVVEGKGIKEPVASMEGVFRFSVDELLRDLEALSIRQIDKILLFGVIPPEKKDETGSEGLSPDSIVCRAVRAVKRRFPGIIVFTDVCLCEYTSHGHCGIIRGHDVENDA